MILAQLLAITCSCMVLSISAAPEQGKLVVNLTNQHRIAGLSKTLHKDATVNIRITSECKSDSAQITAKWLVRSSSCYGEYATITTSNASLQSALNHPELSRHAFGTGEYKKGYEYFNCVTGTQINSNESKWIEYPKALTTAAVTTASVSSSKEKRDAKRPGIPGDVTNIPQEAPYVVIVELWLHKSELQTFAATVHIEMKNPTGYLSAHEYPLLTFYIVMCIIYALYAFTWLVMSACNFRDLLRVQFWIGGVILLGMIEKAVFYSEYVSVNGTGLSVIGASKFAEVVSAMKRALARMLVIIVSLGFGIVKPRLGPMLHRVIGIGILYFILAVIEALVRTDSPVHDPTSNNLLFAAIPLAVVDSVICWWIFMSLMQTMKTLRLRRNVVKLSLYRHFANAIIFCVIASLAMFAYSFRYRDQCISDWQELWIDTAFWHVLFSVMLLVIMILWRPNINNQRYAFSPLIDGDEDGDVESGEPMLGGGATENVKMRGLKNAALATDPANKAEEDLKWIEENIPQTVADAALPAIMDSDEEVMTTKYEMSKME